MSPVNPATSTPVAAHMSLDTSTTKAASTSEQVRLVTDYKNVKSETAHIEQAVAQTQEIREGLVALQEDFQRGLISDHEFENRWRELSSRQEVHLASASQSPEQRDLALAATAPDKSPSTPPKSEESPPEGKAPQESSSTQPNAPRLDPFARSRAIRDQIINDLR